MNMMPSLTTASQSDTRLSTTQSPDVSLKLSEIDDDFQTHLKGLTGLLTARDDGGVMDRPGLQLKDFQSSCGVGLITRKYLVSSSLSNDLEIQRKYWYTSFRVDIVTVKHDGRR